VVFSISELVHQFVSYFIALFYLFLCAQLHLIINCLFVITLTLMLVVFADSFPKGCRLHLSICILGKPRLSRTIS